MVPDKPFLGSKPWAVVLCKFNDDDTEPHPPSFFQKWITRGNNGVNDFFHDVSYGKCNLDGSQVFGWYPLPYSKAEDFSNSRGERIIKAAQAVQDRVDFTKFYGICVITNVNQDSGALLAGVVSIPLNGKAQDYGVVVLGPWGWQPSVACQEIAHGFKLSNHSRNAANPGADYGNPFDIMSALSSYTFSDSRYDYPGNVEDRCGPGMNAPNLVEFGWVDSNRIYETPTASVYDSYGLTYRTNKTFTVQLSALNHPETNKYLCATIRVSDEVLGEFFYYIEYRTADGWDRGMAAGGISDCILIEQVRSDGYNYLVFPSAYSNCLKRGEAFTDASHDITVRVLEFNNHVATVEITLPVWQVFRTPIAGPFKVDWHIYEKAREKIGIAVQAVLNMRNMFSIKTTRQ